jgi:hypothetical protein
MGNLVVQVAISVAVIILALVIYNRFVAGKVG